MCNSYKNENDPGASNGGKRLVTLIAGCMLGLLPAAVLAEEVYVCGPLSNAFGPFDYRVVPPNTKRVVEDHHFTPAVEMLISGNTSATAGGDLDYTLRAMPNHHRALMAMMKLGMKENTEKPRGSHYTVDCWFQRAVQYTPDDPMVRALYASYLIKKGRNDDAARQLQAAEKGAEEDANVAYNVGLAYFDLKKYDKSLTFAQQAYALGFPLQGLRHKLERVGKWRPSSTRPAATRAEKEKPVSKAQSVTDDTDGKATQTNE